MALGICYCMVQRGGVLMSEVPLLKTRLATEIPVHALRGVTGSKKSAGPESR
jgi:hypothetical protein